MSGAGEDAGAEAAARSPNGPSATEPPAHGEVLRSRAQRVAERVHVGPAAAPPPARYEGLVTRTIAFALDAAIIDLAALAVGAAVALAVSVLRLPHGVRTAVIAIGGVAFAAWTVGYFVVFWSTTGQTPGSRVLRIRVRRAGAGAGSLRPGRALLRFAALVLAALPLFAGLLPILFDGRRRGLHDMLAGTVVVGTDEARAAAGGPVAPM